jgi:predicted MFS family arabinose efflux permease
LTRFQHGWKASFRKAHDELETDFDMVCASQSDVVVVAFAVLQWRPRQTEPTVLRENFTESFISSLRYARHSEHMKVILLRNFLFSLVISIVPALLPVLALKEMHLSASEVGLLFTCVGVGSLAGAVFALPYLRERTSSDAITSISVAIMAVILLVMSFTPQLPVLMACAALPGVAWALAGSELWVAGQRVMPGWVRGRMNSFQIMLGQGGIAIGALIWGLGSGKRRSYLDLCCGGYFRPDGVGSRASILNQLRLRSEGESSAS